jgi:hypothetical protein
MTEHLTYYEVVEHLVDYLGGSPGESVLRDAKRSIAEAYREFVNAHKWSYFYKVNRVNVPGPFQAGTVTYAPTGGTWPRSLTLDTGVWPTWAGRGYVRVGYTIYRVDFRRSDTVVTLAEETAPNAAFAAQPFNLYQTAFLLPDDWTSQDTGFYECSIAGLKYVTPQEFVKDARHSTHWGNPCLYTMTNDDYMPGRFSLRLSPMPSHAMTVDFLYRKTPRLPSVYSLSCGTVTQLSGPLMTVSGGPLIQDQYKGSVVRVFDSLPFSTKYGSNPYVFESVILSVESPTQVILADTPTFDLTGKLVQLTDRIDIDTTVMASAYLRCCEKHIGMRRTLKDKVNAVDQYRLALMQARDSDSRSIARQVAGEQMLYRRKLSDYPGTFDII